MYKVRNKKIALMTALVFVMTLVLPMGAAFGADDVDMSKTTATVTDEEPDNEGQALGYISIDNDELDNVDRLYLEVELPSGVEFTNVVNEDSLNKGTLFEVDGTNVAADSVTSFTYDDDEYSATVKAPEGGFTDDFEIKFDQAGKVTVDNDAADEIEVTLNATGASANEDGSYSKVFETGDVSFVLGEKETGDITVSADDPETVKFGSGKDIATITIEEAYAGQLIDDKEDEDGKEYIFLELPDEFKWVKNSVDISGSHELAAEETADHEKNSAQVLVLEVTGTSSIEGKLEIDAQVTVLPDAPEGDLEVEVSSTHDDLDTTDVVVAQVGESDVTVEADSSTGMEDYMRKTEIAELHELTFETSGSFSDGDDILIELPDGFEFNEESVSSSAYPDIDDDPLAMATIDEDNNESELGDNVSFQGLYDDAQGLWLQVDVDEGESVDEITLENLWIAALPDCEYGDIEVEISGDVVETSVVAGKVEPSVTIETEVNKVEPGLTELAGNVTFTETAEDSLPNDAQLYFAVPSGVEFASAPTVEVNGEEIDDVEVVDGTDDEQVMVKLSEMDDNEIDTIVMSDIEYVIDSRFSAGKKIELSFGGQDVLKDHVNKLPDNDQYEDVCDDEIVKVANAVVQEKGTVEASFTLGDEGVAVQNGRTLVQVNKLCDVLGLQKSWDASSKTAYFVKDGTVVAFPIDQNKLVINGNEIVVDQGGTIINNYTYATLRGIQMAFGGDLEWNNETKTATFNFKK